MIGPTGDVAKVELYNLIQGGRAVGNGWLVSKWIDGGTRRAGTLKRFEGDEIAARQYAARYNRVARRRSAFRGEIAQFREHHERVDRKEARALLAAAVRTRHLSQAEAARIYDRLERLHRMISTDANDPRSIQLMRRISHILTKIGPIARGAKRDPRGRVPSSRYYRISPSHARYKKPSAKILHALKIDRVVPQGGRRWLVEFADGMGVHVTQHESRESTLPWYYAGSVHDRVRYYEEARPEPPPALAHAYQYKALTQIVPHQSGFHLRQRTGRYSDLDRFDVMADVHEELLPDAFYRPDERRDPRKRRGRRGLRLRRRAAC